MSRHATRAAARRAPVLAVVAAALIIGALADRAGAPHVNAAVTGQPVQPVPVAAPPGAYSSSWFCAGATNAFPNPAPGRVLVANAGTAPVTGTVTVVASKGASTTHSIRVAAGSTDTVPEAVPGGSAWTGAIVDVDGGSVAVSQVLDGPFGRASSPCATSGSQHWYIPAGQTRVNASETLLLLNPYPTHSLVDLSFSTDQGVEQPQDFQGLDVPPGGLVAVPLGSHLRRRAFIATSVSARTGNVVAWAAEWVTPPPANTPIVGTPAASSPLADPALATPGFTATLGAPSAGTSWAWPSGLAGSGIDERYVIFNPGGQTAQVRLSFGLQRGSAEPLDITVGPSQVVQMVSEQQPRIPAGVSHTATLVSTNGVPVVATRTVSASNGTVFGSGPWSGLGEMLGQRLAAGGWIVALPAADSKHSLSLVVHNGGSGPVAARFSGLSTGEQAVTVGAGGEATVPVPSGGDRTVVVHSPEPLYVELDMFGNGGTPGISFAPAVPMSMS
jgi:hypothetical protein